MSEEAIAALKRRLGTRWTRGCPMCGHTTWTALGYSLLELSDAPRPRSVIGARGLATVAMACGSCGFIAQVLLHESDVQ